jgi:ribonuclease J
VALGGRIELGPFTLDLITLTHSIPEPNGLAIRTPLGVILHTGDWKIDPAPVLGQTTDVDALRKLGDEGVWPWSATRPTSSSKARRARSPDVREVMAEVIKPLKGKVAVGCFASNVARMDSVIRAAEAAGRRVVLVGRSMHRMVAAARSVGMLKDVQEFIPDSEARNFPATSWCTCAPAARASPGRPCPGSPRAPTRTYPWGKATW